MTPNRRHISKAAARGHKQGVADQCFQDDQIFTIIVKKIERKVYEELKSLCSLKVNSILRDGSSKSVKNFKWESFLSEIQAHAPILYRIVLACTRTKHPRPNRNGLIGLCIALLAKYRCPHMNLFHKIISLVLYSGHSGKQVCKQ